MNLNNRGAISTGPGAESLRAAHRRALANIRETLELMAGAAVKIGMQVDQVLAEGGILPAQPQMMQLTGALARLQKDWGVAEYLQHQGASQPPASKMARRA